MVTSKLPDILAQKAALEAEVEKVRLEELEQVVAELRQTIETYKITPEQLFPNVVVATKYAARRGIRRPPKYRNSEGQTWGGAQAQVVERGRSAWREHRAVRHQVSQSKRELRFPFLRALK